MTTRQLTQQDWVQISGFLPGRNDFQCKYRFLQQKQDSVKKASWVKKEDEMLIKIIKEMGNKHWNHIAEVFNQSLED